MHEFRRGEGRATPPEGMFVDLSATEYSTCGVRADGALQCWGTWLVDLPSGGSFVQVSVSDGIRGSGGPHGCALGADGSVRCWGHDTFGQASPPGGEFVQVSAGGANSCGVRVGGSLACWGDDSLGQLDVPEGDFRVVYAGSPTCAVGADGALVCWGGPPRTRRRMPDAPGGAFVEVSAAAGGSDRRDPGADYACGLRPSGQIECWAAPFGAGFDFGQADAPEGQFVALSAGGEHACAIDADGRAVCWGNNDTRQVDPVENRWGWTVGNHSCHYDSAYDHAFPEGPLDCSLYRGPGVREPVAADHPHAASPQYWGVHDGLLDPLRGPFTQVSAGVKNTCAVRVDAVLVCWPGMQGLEVLGGEFSEVALGASHGCALRVGGEAVCWGIGAGDERWEGQTETPGGVFAQISAGDDHTCGLRTGGEVACWGADNRGQSDAPSGVFVEVSAVGDSTCAVRSDATPVCWGDIAGLVPPPGEFTSVVAAGHRGRPCGVRSDDSVVCWGYEDGLYDAPRWLGPLEAASVDARRGCGIETGGALVCWVHNTKARTVVGSGEFEFSAFGGGPVGTCALDVAGAVHCWGYYLDEPPDGEFVDVAVGGGHACAIAGDGTVKCWGSDVTVIENPVDD